MSRILALVLLALPVAAAAQDMTPPSETPKAPEANPGDQIVCKRYQTSGTRLGVKRVCLRKSEWEAQAHDAQANLQRQIELQSAASPNNE